MNMQNIQRITIMALILATLALAGCKSKNPTARQDATQTGDFGWIFEGWACQPDAVAGKGHPPSEYCKWEENLEKARDYLYIKVSAAPSKLSLKEKNLSMKMATCRQSAKDQVNADALEKIIGAVVVKHGGVLDGRSTGFAILSKVKGKISGTGIYDCCSIDNKTGKCANPTENEPEKWDACMCVGYIRYPGGQDAFESKAVDVARELN